MRENLYGIQEMDPTRTAGPWRAAAENAIRGQLGPAPPPLGQSAQSYGELREAQRQQQVEARANNMAAINADAIPWSGGGWNRTANARLAHLYKNPLYGRGKKGGQRLMELAAQSRR